MKNILLLVHHDCGQEARLQAALDLTRAFGGHLACLDVTPYPVMVSATHFGSAEAVVVREESESEAKNRAIVSDRLMHEDVRWSWSDTMDDSAAWHADYIVMGGYGRGRLRETFGGVTRHMLAESQCPLLLCH